MDEWKYGKCVHTIERGGISYLCVLIYLETRRNLVSENVSALAVFPIKNIQILLDFDRVLIGVCACWVCVWFINNVFGNTKTIMEQKIATS